ncbi:MAG: hypothetical protein ACTSYM_05960 [Candidatus Baldrarchaeia archaeon]
MKENNIKIKNSELKSIETKMSIKCPDISPKDLFMLFYITLSQLDVKILKITEKLKKGNLVVGELYFQAPKQEKAFMSLVLNEESNQFTITCKYKEINEVKSLIHEIENKVFRLAENFSKLNEKSKEELRELFKVVKEVDRAIQSILSQKGVEELYFSLSLLRERACNYAKDLLDISIKTGQWLNILNRFRKNHNVELTKETAKKLLLDLLYWKKRILQEIRNIKEE